jgi:hypothetical protein
MKVREITNCICAGVEFEVMDAEGVCAFNSIELKLSEEEKYKAYLDAEVIEIFPDENQWLVIRADHVETEKEDEG